MESHNLLKSNVMAVIALVIAVTVAIPILTDALTTTTHTENQGAGWVKLGYIEDATTTDYTFEITVSGDTAQVEGLSGATDTVIYADTNGALTFTDGSLKYLYLEDQAAVFKELGATVTVTNASGQLTVTDGDTTVNRSSPTWAYTPDSDGSFRSCSEGNLKTTGEPLAAVGSYLGVYAYNTLIYPDYGLVLNADTDEDMINSVTWSMED